MPAKNSETAKSTTASMKLSARSRESLARVDSAWATPFRRVASVFSATWYSGMTKGVPGASGFVSGLVASHASNAGLNSGRNRWR